MMADMGRLVESDCSFLCGLKHYHLWKIPLIVYLWGSRRFSTINKSDIATSKHNPNPA